MTGLNKPSLKRSTFPCCVRNDLKLHTLTVTQIGFILQLETLREGFRVIPHLTYLSFYGFQKVYIGIERMT
jgi:hypothetical protein